MLQVLFDLKVAILFLSTSLRSHSYSRIFISHRINQMFYGLCIAYLSKRNCGLSLCFLSFIKSQFISKFCNLSFSHKIKKSH